jgi:CBS domain-containing protein
MGIKTDQVGLSMTRNVIYLEKDQPLSDAWDIMEDCGIRHIPIVDSNLRLEGILSDRDLLLRIELTDDEKISIPDLLVSDAMTDNPMTCDSSTPICRAAELMIDSKIDCLPVVGPNGCLEGLITSTDIMGLLTGDEEIDFGNVIPFEYNLNSWDQIQRN